MWSTLKFTESTESRCRSLLNGDCISSLASLFLFLICACLSFTNNLLRVCVRLVFLRKTGAGSLARSRCATGSTWSTTRPRGTTWGRSLCQAPSRGGTSIPGAGLHRCSVLLLCCCGDRWAAFVGYSVACSVSRSARPSVRSRKRTTPTSPKCPGSIELLLVSQSYFIGGFYPHFGDKSQ